MFMMAEVVRHRGTRYSVAVTADQNVDLAAHYASPALKSQRDFVEQAIAALSELP
jgi:hypothetical protein